MSSDPTVPSPVLESVPLGESETPVPLVPTIACMEPETVALPVLPLGEGETPAPLVPTIACLESETDAPPALPLGEGESPSPLVPTITCLEPETDALPALPLGEGETPAPLVPTIACLEPETDAPPALPLGEGETPAPLVPTIACVEPESDAPPALPLGEGETPAPLLPTIACLEPETDAPPAPGDDEDKPDVVPEKQYHELEPARQPGRGGSPAPAAAGIVKTESPLSIPLPISIPRPGAAAAAARPTLNIPAVGVPCGGGGGGLTRRSRRLAKDETVPLKKRKRVFSPELDDDEYILPTHIQLQVDKAAVAAEEGGVGGRAAAAGGARDGGRTRGGDAGGGRRLRPKRSCQKAGAQSLAEDELAIVLTECSPDRKIKKEEEVDRPTGDGDVIEVPMPPKRKRGRPRKNQAPQRCEAALVAAVSSGVTETWTESVPAPSPKLVIDPEPRRRGRKSAVPARRGPRSDPPVAVKPPSPASPPPLSPPPPPPASPPRVETFRLCRAGLALSEPLSLTDEQFLLEVPTRRLKPCRHCASLSCCPGQGTAQDHDHTALRKVEPQTRIEVIVEGDPAAEKTSELRTTALGDQERGEVVSVISDPDKVVRRRGLRRGSGRRAVQESERDLECQICGKTMLSVSRLKKHQLVHTDERPFHCDKCPKSFKSIHVLNAHQLTHINYRPFKCHICLQTFAKKWTLRGHMSTHDRQEGADELRCQTCGCEFLDRSTFESHVKIHTGERKWECKVCHRGFAKKLKLRKHMVVHSKAMLHKCHLCDREFRWKEKLVKHIMLHTGERPFKCGEPRCTKSFRAHSDLNVHIRNVHKKQPKKLDYPIIKSEPKPNHCELLLMRVNEMEGIPRCDLCTRSFTTKDHYLNHIIPAHRDQEAYVCHPCKRVFSDKRVYEDHVDERHRRGEIMWRCQLCPKIFNKRSLFEGHKTLHNTKFQCKICFRFASDEKRLQIHIMGHQYTDIDNSSHACTICSRQFKLRFSLKNHMFKMHSIDLPSLRKPPMRKFECSICHARFVRPTPAYNHMVRVHNIRPEPELQDLFDLSNHLSVENSEAMNALSPGSAAAASSAAASASADGAAPADERAMIAALQNNIRIKVEAMAAQGMWDASEADGSTYLGGSGARRRQPAARLAAGDAPGPASPAGSAAELPRLGLSPGGAEDPDQLHTPVLKRDPLAQAQDPLASAQDPLGSAQDPLVQTQGQAEDPLAQTQDPLAQAVGSLAESPDPLAQAVDPIAETLAQMEAPVPGQVLASAQLSPPPPPPLPAGDGPCKTLLHLSPGKKSHVVRVSDSPLQLPPMAPGATPTSVPGAPVGPQRQQIIVIQQEGEEDIDLSRVLGGGAPSDAQTLTMNADGVLVDDQGNPVSLMVEGGGTATHLLEYLRGSEQPAGQAV